jgi:tripartite-type tricarboxylate transporter receptor subunit TctC
MPITPRRLLLSVSVAVASASAVTVDAQEAYPSKPITIVVPYPPGGSNDSFARQVGKALGDALKTTVVVDNRPGASGNIGAGQVARATPDGYTLVAVSSSMTTNAAIQPKMPFDPTKDFAPVAMMAKGPFIAAVSNDVPVKTPAELVEMMKKQPGKLNYASSGLGSSNQFATEMLKAATGTSIVHVPYRGMSQAVTGLSGGETQLLIASGPSLLPQIRSGRIRAIGITSLKASPIAPDLEPMATAVPGYEFELWWGLLAPAGTPPAIVEKLNTEVNRIVSSPAIKDAFLKEGAEASPMTAAQFAAVIAADIPRWKQIARQQGITAE